MINIFAIKNDHTLYNVLRNTFKSIDFDCNIIGLDDPHSGMNLPFYSNEEFYKKPFFLYLEEFKTFRREEIINNKNFLGFISHIKNTCEQVFEKYNCNTYHLDLSSPDKNYSIILQNIESLKSDRPINLIAWGSWIDINDNNFFERGGDKVDDIACYLLQNNININLTFRTNKNLKCKNLFPDKVNIIKEYISENELQELYYKSDIFLLPSRQVHSCSLTNAMSFGLCLIVSDGWGMDEYCNKLNSINYNEINQITDICSNREKLIQKRLNSLRNYKLKHSSNIHKEKAKNLIEIITAK
jgi:glycosyltransferase involved in cell wall biosynthesis